MALRKALRGLTPEERKNTAQKVGVTPEYLRLVAGGWKNTSIDVAEKLETLFGKPGAELLSEPNRKLLYRLRKNGQ